MTAMTEVAERFFEACETGRGWDACQEYCSPGATFSAQSEALAEIHDLQGYTEWMKGLLSILPDASYEVKSFATDEQRGNVSAYAIFSGTHTGVGGPCPPTGKSAKADYVYVMEFAGDKICHLTKIWNSGYTMQELGWV